MKPRVLSISYDSNLLRTRNLLLAEAGYEVTSAQGFADAMACCARTFDVVVMGHSIPHDDKRVIVAALREHGCKAPILSLVRANERPIPEANLAVDPSSPGDVLEAVSSLLREGEA